MFNKSTPKQKLGKTIDSFETIIGTTVRIDGNLSISQSVRIDGVVNGNIFQDEGSQASIAIAKGAEREMTAKALNKNLFKSIIFKILLSLI